MIHTANTVRTLQAVAMTVGVALLLWSTGLPTIFRFAEAASITSASDTLSSSVASAASNHTFRFTTPNGMAANQTITITFPAQFTIPALGIEDFDLTASGTQKTIAPTNGTGGTWGVSTSSQTITFTSPSDVSQSSSTVFAIYIGTNASTSGSGNTQITNPAATSSYAIVIAGSMPDSGEVRVAIVDQVTVSASVDTSLTFTVAGVPSGQAVNGSPTTTATGTTAIALPFETLTANVSKVIAQDLTVSTNAYNGFTVTVEQSGLLQSSTGATIDGFIDGAYTTTPTAWTAPAGLVTNSSTYGHWGLTSNDTNVAARSSQFGSDQWVSGSTTPVAVMGHSGPVLATTTRIGYQAQISALQEAGDDYTTTLRYIVTPTF